MADLMTTAWVLGQPYSVEVVSDPEEALTRGSDPDFGLTDNKRQVIKVRGDQSAASIRDTVLHEVIHACLHVVGCQLDNDAEEVIVAQLSGVLLDCLRKSPWLVQLLLAPDGPH